MIPSWLIDRVNELELRVVRLEAQIEWLERQGVVGERTILEIKSQVMDQLHEVFSNTVVGQPAGRRKAQT